MKPYSTTGEQSTIRTTPSAKMLAICYLKADQPEKIGPLVSILMPHKTEHVDYVTVLVAYAISRKDATLYREVIRDVPQDLISQREGLVKLVDKGNQMFKE